MKSITSLLEVGRLSKLTLKALKRYRNALSSQVNNRVCSFTQKFISDVMEQNSMGVKRLLYFE